MERLLWTTEDDDAFSRSSVVLKQTTPLSSEMRFDFVVKFLSELILHGLQFKDEEGQALIQLIEMHLGCLMTSGAIKRPSITTQDILGAFSSSLSILNDLWGSEYPIFRDEDDYATFTGCDKYL